MSRVSRGASPRPIDDSKYFDDEGEFAWVRIADVSASSGELTQTTQRLSALGASLSVPIMPGELFVSIAGTVGKPCISGLKACIHDGFVYFPDLVPEYKKFLYYVFEAGEVYKGLGKFGTQLNLNTDTVGSIVIPVPSPHGALEIVNFLDDKTARIDALIAEKERLATSLEEYRLSAINSAVSTGLSSSPGLSETSDEWFEKIPTHWSFCPLNYRYEIQLGKMLDEKQITGNFLRPYLRNTDVQWGKINVENLPQMDISPNELSRYSVMPGDLMVCEGGDVGRAAIWHGTAGEIAYQKALHRVRPRSQRDLPKFMYYCLFDSAKRGRFSGRGQATISHLTAEAFRRYRFAFPPVEEQQAIVLHLDGITQKLDTLVSHCEEHIARLREYRSSLISAAVTGQLDISTLHSPIE